MRPRGSASGVMTGERADISYSKESTILCEFGCCQKLAHTNDLRYDSNDSLDILNGSVSLRMAR